MASALPSSTNMNHTTSHVDIASIPSNDLLKLLAQLLQRIATTNDKTRSTLPPQSSNFDPPVDAPVFSSLTTASKSSLINPSAPLSFHARNVPTISIESYLLRILKYCPTTNEVFLSLLVYFDRMAKLGRAVSHELRNAAHDPPPQPDDRWSGGLAIDSYNVHRLIISGVTVASKFFSDVFYTNSRYAKVGGLPQSELNQLELQFLLLNDFRLVIPLEELQRYADELVLYGAKAQEQSTDEWDKEYATHGFFRERIEPVPVFRSSSQPYSYQSESIPVSRSSSSRPPYVSPTASCASSIASSAYSSDVPLPTPTSSTSTITQEKMAQGITSGTSTPTGSTESADASEDDDGTRIEDDEDEDNDMPTKHSQASSDNGDDVNENDLTIRAPSHQTTLSDIRQSSGTPTFTHFSASRTPNPRFSASKTSSRSHQSSYRDHLNRSPDEVAIVKDVYDGSMTRHETDGYWDRKAKRAKGVKTDGSDDQDQGHETEDEVVYRPAALTTAGTRSR